MKNPPTFDSTMHDTFLFDVRLYSFTISSILHNDEANERAMHSIYRIIYKTWPRKEKNI